MQDCLMMITLMQNCLMMMTFQNCFQDLKFLTQMNSIENQMCAASLSSGLTMKYDQEKQIEGVKGVVKTFTAGDGANEAKISVQVCPMGFPNNLLFAKAGDYTGGAEAVD
jgi:hypothetical protein